MKKKKEIRRHIAELTADEWATHQWYEYRDVTRTIWSGLVSRGHECPASEVEKRRAEFAIIQAHYLAELQSPPETS